MPNTTSPHPYLSALFHMYAKLMDHIMGQRICIPSEKYKAFENLGSAFMADYLSVQARIKAEQELEEPLFY